MTIFGLTTSQGRKLTNNLNSILITPPKLYESHYYFKQKITNYTIPAGVTNSHFFFFTFFERSHQSSCCCSLSIYLLINNNFRLQLLINNNCRRKCYKASNFLTFYLGKLVGTSKSGICVPFFVGCGSYPPSSARLLPVK